MWVRIDNRLVHGQVIEGWIPHTKSKVLMVIDDDLSSDLMRQTIVGLAIPAGIEVIFTSIYDAPDFLQGLIARKVEDSLLVLFADCDAAKAAYDRGLEFEVLNIGNLHYGPGKEQVCDHIAVSEDDLKCLKYLSYKGVQLDFRCVPNKSVQMALW